MCVMKMSRESTMHATTVTRWPVTWAELESEEDAHSTRPQWMLTSNHMLSMNEPRASLLRDLLTFASSLLLMCLRENH